MVRRGYVVGSKVQRAGGLSSDQVCPVVADVSAVVDVVGLTVGEFIPRQIIALQQILADLPLMD
ncbi:arginase [Microlunatus soli]|uniref:Arginase n=1 Tax=Microlunatus soli TaxID=630515 RepID=A0A1H1SUE4_9ACTN|nr:arginase [Microlunatus soli]